MSFKSITRNLTSEDLMRQAWKTADEYLGHAIDCIDARLGDGYAKENPALVGAFMQAAACDFAAAIKAQIATEINEVLDRISDRLP